MRKFNRDFHARLPNTKYLNSCAYTLTQSIGTSTLSYTGLTLHSWVYLFSSLLFALLKYFLLLLLLLKHKPKQHAISATIVIYNNHSIATSTNITKPVGNNDAGSHEHAHCWQRCCCTTRKTMLYTGLNPIAWPNLLKLENKSVFEYAQIIYMW